MKVEELRIGQFICYNKVNNYITQIKEICCTGDGEEYYIKGYRDKKDPLYKEFFIESFNVSLLSSIKIKDIWIDAKDEEPTDLEAKICIYHPNFRDKIIICDKYNPSEKVFYYEDGEYISEISLNHKGLKWTYIKNLIPNEV